MNIFKQFIVSLYSPKEIVGFRNQGIGKTILFIFLLSLISIIPSAYYISTLVTEGVSSIKETLTNDLPNFEINNGTLSAESDEPIKAIHNGFTIFMDDSGELTSDQVKRESSQALGLLKKEMVIVDGETVQVMPYSSMNSSLSNEDLLSVINLIDSNMAICISIVVVMLYLFTAATMFIKITIFSFFALLFNNSLGHPLVYRQLWRLSAYCVTLATVFFTIMEAAQANVPMESFINWFVTLLMLYLTIKEAPVGKDGKSLQK